jgi:hypothetical protein
MNTISDPTRNAPPRGVAARLALWMLWLALALTVVGAVLVFVYARFVPVSDAQSQWTPEFPPILVVAVSLLASIWALRLGHLLLTTGLTLVAAVLAAIMSFLVAFGVGMITSEAGFRTTPSPTWVNIIDAVVAACFALCVLAFIACIVSLVRQRLHSTS